MEQKSAVAGLVDKAALCAMLMISERGIENMVKGGIFPKGVRIGKRVYWSEIAVNRWREAFFTAQESWTSDRGEAGS